MLLQDFNYFFNKAINQYINKRYNIYDVNQQTTDDLRVLKATTVLNPIPVGNTIGGIDTSEWKTGAAPIFGATYEVFLPLDYLHMLNCICVYKLNKRHKCYNAGDYVQFAAKRLTADSWSIILNDYYNRPLPERPYYYIHNINQSVDLPTNPVNNVAQLRVNLTGTDAAKDYTNNLKKYVSQYKDGSTGTNITIQNPELDEMNELSTWTANNPNHYVMEVKEVSKQGQTNLPRFIDITNFANKSVVEKEAGQRYGNSSSVRCEIRYGKDSSVFKLQSVLIDYIKSPQVIRLTQEQVDLTEDTSQIMEFPDYVCQEIINELVTLVMENTADPRLYTNNSVTQSIANPLAQQQAPQQPQQQRRG